MGQQTINIALWRARRRRRMHMSFIYIYHGFRWRQASIRSDSLCTMFAISYRPMRSFMNVYGMLSTGQMDHSKMGIHLCCWNNGRRLLSAYSTVECWRRKNHRSNISSGAQRKNKIGCRKMSQFKRCRSMPIHQTSYSRLDHTLCTIHGCQTSHIKRIARCNAINCTPDRIYYLLVSFNGTQLNYYAPRSQFRLLHLVISIWFENYPRLIFGWCYFFFFFIEYSENLPLVVLYIVIHPISPTISMRTEEGWMILFLDNNAVPEWIRTQRTSFDMSICKPQTTNSFRRIDGVYFFTCFYSMPKINKDIGVVTGALALDIWQHRRSTWSARWARLSHVNVELSTLPVFFSSCSSPPRAT